MRTVFLGLICLGLVFLPLLLMANEPPTVEEYTQALSPDTKGAPAKYTAARGLGGTQTIVRKPQVAMRLKFSLNSAQLTPEAQAALNNLGQALEKEALRGYIYRLEGHTCDLGSAEYNLNLSRQRAISVRNYLVEYFQINRQQFEVEGYGEIRPTVKNADEASRKQNRRVTIINTLKPFDLPMATSSPAILQIKRLRGEQEEIVPDGATLIGSDRYAVEVKVDRKFYVYLFQVGKTGKVVPLFPGTAFCVVKNPLSAGDYLRVPDADQWFYLDDNIGKEIVILLASQHAIDDPASLCAQIADKEKGAKMLAVKNNSKTRIRGFGGVVADSPQRQFLAEGPSVKTSNSNSEESRIFVIRRYFNHQ